MTRLLDQLITLSSLCCLGSVVKALIYRARIRPALNLWLEILRTPNEIANRDVQSWAQLADAAHSTHTHQLI